MYRPIRWRDQLAGILVKRARVHRRSPERMTVLRLTAEQDRLLREAASLMEAPPTEFVLEAALTRARTVVDLNASASSEDAFDRFMATPDHGR
jgi:uncharacterized protein (DUF1778 family)